MGPISPSQGRCTEQHQVCRDVLYTPYWQEIIYLEETTVKSLPKSTVSFKVNY